MQWNDIKENVPVSEKRLIATNIIKKDDIKRYKFGCKFHILHESWEDAIRDEFRKRKLTHWIYIKDLFDK